MEKPTLNILTDLDKVSLFLGESQIDASSLGISQNLLASIYKAYSSGSVEAEIDKAVISVTKLLPKEIFNQHRVMLQTCTGIMIEVT